MTSYLVTIERPEKGQIKTELIPVDVQTSFLDAAAKYLAIYQEAKKVRDEFIIKSVSKL